MKHLSKESLRLFSKLLLIIFLVEAAIMMLFYVANIEGGIFILVDPLLLAILLAPLLFFLIIIPRNNADQAVRNVLGMTSMNMGEDYFDAVVTNLARWLKADIVILGQFTPDGKNEILSMFHDGKIIKEYKYNLKGTPCNNVRKKGFCIYKEGTYKLFPDDAELQEMKTEGYIGTPILDSGRRAVGILCVVSKKKIRAPQHIEEIFNILAGRVVSEIKHMAAEKEALELAKMKSHFVSIVSHELKTPMTAIKESVGLLVEDYEKIFDESHLRLFTILQKNIDRLVKLTTDILELQKYSAGTITLNKDLADITEIINEAYDIMEAAIQEKGLAFRLSPLNETRKVSFDRDRILQVLINILGNAIKFTDEGEIEIATQMDDNSIVVSIKDTGPGIEEKNLSKMFDVFEQYSADPSIRRQGSGLGLSISKQIVESHGGKIWATSKLGEGTTLSFSLPIN